jgi:hypothetical protein
MQKELGVDGSIPPVRGNIIQNGIPDVPGSGFEAGFIPDLHINVECVTFKVF